MLRLMMDCKNCPYGIEDFERRMYWYEKTIAEQGIPNDIYHYLKPQDAPEEFEQFLWCDKVGGKVYCFGHCTDFFEDSEDINKEISSKQKRRNKRERDLKYKNHLKKLHKDNLRYPDPVSYIEEKRTKDNELIKLSKPYYKRNYRGKSSKYFKKKSNRKIRRFKGELHNGNQCHRLYDFWFK